LESAEGGERLGERQRTIHHRGTEDAEGG
jgi:hypothetical protein